MKKKDIIQSCPSTWKLNTEKIIPINENTRVT